MKIVDAWATKNLRNQVVIINQVLVSSKFLGVLVTIWIIHDHVGRFIPTPRVDVPISIDFQMWSVIYTIVSSDRWRFPLLKGGGFRIRGHDKPRLMGVAFAIDPFQMAKVSKKTQAASKQEMKLSLILNVIDPKATFCVVGVVEFDLPSCWKMALEMGDSFYCYISWILFFEMSGLFGKKTEEILGTKMFLPDSVHDS